MPKEESAKLPGYAADVAGNQAQAQKIMAGLGYGPNKPLKVKVSVRNIAIYRDPAVILIDQLKKIYIQAELEPDRHHGVVRQGAAPRLLRQPEFDRNPRLTTPTST